MCKPHKMAKCDKRSIKQMSRDESDFIELGRWV
jgi:hypothetical protein